MLSILCRSVGMKSQDRINDEMHEQTVIHTLIFRLRWLLMSV